MTIIERIPVTLTKAEIAARLRFDPAKAGFDELDGSSRWPRALSTPAAFMTLPLSGRRGDADGRGSGVTFQSPILRQNLETTNKVFPYIITVGPELEREAPPKTISSSNIISRKWPTSPLRRLPPGSPGISKDASA